MNSSGTQQALAKKKRPKAAVGKLSFGIEEEEGAEEEQGQGKDKEGDAKIDKEKSDSDVPAPTSAAAAAAAVTGAQDAAKAAIKAEKPEASSTSHGHSDNETAAQQKKRLGPNTAVSVMPKVVTKSTLLREAQMREQLRKEFLAMQKAVRATEIVIPFVFYDGTNIPGGHCKITKGDHIWLLLEKARKVGAERGIGGAGERASSRREWARVGIDDLLLVRGELIIPHVSFLYFFII